MNVLRDARDSIHHHSILSSRPILRDGTWFYSLPRRSLSSLYWRHPHRRASIRTLNGPLWVRCKLGSDFKPGSITTVMNPGCWGTAI